MKFSNVKVPYLKIAGRLLDPGSKFDFARPIFSTRAAVIAMLALGALGAPARLSAQSLSESVEAIDKARVTTRILFITAHPDDEASSLLVYLSRGLDADVALMTLTRGQGGQNAIGPEQGAQLGMLRTEELLGASHHNGVTQFFSRAPDFGFSKSPDQTLTIWGDVPLEDMVRVIRTFRPDIVINGWGGVHWGHGQHQASGILTPQAVVAAADKNKFPNQIQEGLSPWTVSLVLDSERDETPSGYRVPLNDVSPVWGKSYNEMGRESLVYHRSQGVTMFAESPFFRRPQYLIVEPKTSGGATNTSLHRNVLATTLPDLAHRYPTLEGALRPALQSIDQLLGEARQLELALDRAAAAAKLAQAALQIQELRKGLTGQSGDQASAAAWEIARVRDRIDLALRASNRVAAAGPRRTQRSGGRREFFAQRRCRRHSRGAGEMECGAIRPADAQGLECDARWREERRRKLLQVHGERSRRCRAARCTGRRDLALAASAGAGADTNQRRWIRAADPPAGGGGSRHVHQRRYLSARIGPRHFSFGGTAPCDAPSERRCRKRSETHRAAGARPQSRHPQRFGFGGHGRSARMELSEDFRARNSRVQRSIGPLRSRAAAPRPSRARIR